MCSFLFAVSCIVKHFYKKFSFLTFLSLLASHKLSWYAPKLYLHWENLRIIGIYSLCTLGKYAYYPRSLSVCMSWCIPSLCTLRKYAYYPRILSVYMSWCIPSLYKLTICSVLGLFLLILIKSYSAHPCIPQTGSACCASLFIYGDIIFPYINNV